MSRKSEIKVLFFIKISESVLNFVEQEEKEITKIEMEKDQAIELIRMHARSFLGDPNVSIAAFKKFHNFIMESKIVLTSIIKEIDMKPQVG
jgi:hypothetical protein